MKEELSFEIIPSKLDAIELFNFLVMNCKFTDVMTLYRNLDEVINRTQDLRRLKEKE